MKSFLYLDSVIQRRSLNDIKNERMAVVSRIQLLSSYLRCSAKRGINFLLNCNNVYRMTAMFSSKIKIRCTNVGNVNSARRMYAKTILRNDSGKSPNLYCNVLS